MLPAIWPVVVCRFMMVMKLDSLSGVSPKRYNGESVEYTVVLSMKDVRLTLDIDMMGEKE